MNPRRLMPWVTVAALALVAAWFAQLQITTRFEAQVLRDQLAIVDLALQGTRQELEAERILAELSPVPGSPANRGAGLAIGFLLPAPDSVSVPFAVAVWDPVRQEGWLRVDGLPAPGPEADYQLWVSDSEYPDPVDAGVLPVDPQTSGASLVFSTRRPVHAVTSFEITRERKGGAPAPAGPVVLRGRPSF